MQKIKRGGGGAENCNLVRFNVSCPINVFIIEIFCNILEIKYIQISLG